MAFEIVCFNIIQYYIFNDILIYLYKTALYLAVEKENIEIVKLLLTNDKIDINLTYITYRIFNNILNAIYKSNSK